MRHSSALPLLFLVTLCCGCGGGSSLPHDGFSRTRKTCVVLSVGGAGGLAHAGALDELARRGVRIDCIVGNSMGALVGGLYAADPSRPAVESVEGVLAAYVRRTEADGAGAALLGGLLGLFTGGAGLALVGAGLGAASLDRLDIDRAESVIDAYVAHVQVEDSSIPFATFYVERRGEGIEMVRAEQMRLSQAIAHSISNPYIWEDVSTATRRRLDPGADRVAAVPVEDACLAFPDAQLIVLNATNHSAFVSHGMHCPTWEIALGVGDVASSMALGDAEKRAELYALGAQAVRGAFE